MQRGMRGFGLLSALLVAAHLRTAAGLSICGSWRRPVALGPWQTTMCTANAVNADSTLAQLRVYVKENGLAVKTAGPGRNKEAILSDILRITEQDGGTPAGSQEETPGREPEIAVEEKTTTSIQVLEPPLSTDAEAATEAAATEVQPATEATPAPDAAPPDGFTWGATY